MYDSSSEEDFVSARADHDGANAVLEVVSAHDHSSDEDFRCDRAVAIPHAIIPFAPAVNAPPEIAAAAMQPFISITRKRKPVKVAPRVLKRPSAAQRISKKPAAASEDVTVDGLVA